MNTRLMLLGEVLNPEGEQYKKIINARMQLEKEVAQIIENIRLNQIDILNYVQGTMPVSFRIKSKNSFIEKISRNSYVEKWDIENTVTDKDSAFKSVCTNLTDLIGARINCLFESDEEEIYRYLKTNKNQYSHLNLNFEENTKMKNGKDVFKFSGKILSDEQLFSFEIQIKSSITNLWGEIEHTSVYKRKDYIPNNAMLQKEIIEQSYSILKGSDSQLKTILTEEIKEEELKKGLFYEYSKGSVNINSFQSKDYEMFYDIFTRDHTFKKAFDYFISQKIIGVNEYELVEWRDEQDVFEDSTKKNLKNLIINSKNYYRVKNIEELFNILFKSDSDFIDIILQRIITNNAPFDYMTEFEDVDEGSITLEIEGQEEESHEETREEDNKARFKQTKKAIEDIFGKEDE